MAEHKITEHSFDKGSFHEALHSGMHRAELSDQGRGRVNDAMKAAMEHVAKQHDLRLGVGSNHFDEIGHFLDTKYESRRDLLPKEREFIHNTLKSHYGLPANDTEAPAAHKEAA